MSYATAIELLKDTLSSLKDFQRATVKSVLKSYQDKNHSQRVLVADEVGLGKTIVAKGVIAELLIAQLSNAKRDENLQPLRVTYICSNQTLASENRAKLAVFKSNAQAEYVQEPRYDRLISTAMVNIVQSNVPEKVLEICSLTPSTSFNLTQGDGNWRERLILVCALLAHPKLAGYEANLLPFWQAGIQDFDKWKNRYLEFKNTKKFNSAILSSFHDLLAQPIPAADLDHCELPKFSTWLELNAKLVDNSFVRKHPQRIRSCMRVLMAKACAQNISADLFILDEFQRFRGLLNTEQNSEESIIAQHVFSSCKSNESKILLLSATPFKAYSQIHEEENGDAHAVELNYLLKFISKNNIELLDGYHAQREAVQRQIISLKDPSTDLSQLDHKPKNAIEACLQPLIFRTERSQVSEGYESVFSTIKGECTHTFSAKDIQVFKAMDAVSEALHSVSKGHYRGQLMEFYKATPWAFSFLSGYQFRKQLDHFGKDEKSPVYKALEKSSAAWLRRSNINNYSLKLSDAPHAKTKALTQRLFSTRSELLLWVPPSMPHYPLQGNFKGQENFSKTLLFSSWALVPRALSSLISYEAERRLVMETKAKGKAKTKVRKYYQPHSPKIKFDQAASLSGWSLIYPAKTLIEHDLPYGIASLNELLNARTEFYKTQLQCLTKFEDGRSSGDRWFALAPMLLDRENGFENYLNTWLSGLPAAEAVSQYSAQGKEIVQFLLEGDNLKLGPMPVDLERYLALLSIAGPAVCTARSWCRIWESADTNIIAQAASKVALGFVSLFNKAESETILQTKYGQQKFFSAIANYCADGNLQAVIDEYGHLLADSGLENATNKLASVVGFRTTSISCQFEEDKLNYSSQTAEKTNKSERNSLRCHYAVPLGNQALTDEKGLSRIEDVRDAFNSPFRPFVLNSTSIGQEGLDFHWYCRQIVHWNLPNNPIDIEQREGRVNRYKSLVVRKRVAQAYAGKIQTFSGEPWDSLFTFADQNTKESRQSDLVPYWHYPEGDACIERYVPMKPMSKEIVKLDNALKVLVHYRLAFGQPRQEELLNNVLHQNFTPEQFEQIKDALVINLSPLMNEPAKTFSENEV